MVPIITLEPESVISQVEVSAAAIAPVTPVNSSSIDLGNLFGTSASTDTTTTEEELPTALEVETITPVMETVPPVAETEEEEKEEEKEEVDTAPLINFAPVAVIAEPESYERTSDFIAGSIEKIDMMITRIDTAHSAKLGEALGYKTEKEKYTTLEETAYADAQSLVEEKDRALTMRAYFVAQGTTESGHLASIEESNSVETTLTELAVQNAVTETVKHAKKPKAKIETEEEMTELIGI